MKFGLAKLLALPLLPGVAVAQCGNQWIGNTAGTNYSGFVDAFATWDPDGADSQIPNLVAVGSSFPYVGRWNGISWSALGNGPNGVTRRIASWDPDGDSPRIPACPSQAGFGPVEVVSPPFFSPLRNWFHF